MQPPLGGGGVDSSYHIQTNVSVNKGIIQGINVHSIVHKVERYWFSSVCTFKKAIKFFEVNVDSQKWALRSLEKKTQQ